MTGPERSPDASGLIGLIIESGNFSLHRRRERTAGEAARPSPPGSSGKYKTVLKIGYFGV